MQENITIDFVVGDKVTSKCPLRNLTNCGTELLVLRLAIRYKGIFRAATTRAPQRVTRKTFMRKAKIKTPNLCFNLIEVD